MNDLTLNDLNAVTTEVSTKFGALSAEEINWKPNPDSWSVGQCLEHLIKTNELFFPTFDAVGSGRYEMTAWQKFSPLSGFGGRFLVRSLQSDKRKFKIPTQKIAPPSAVSADIVADFAKHQSDLIERLRPCVGRNTERIIVTSPFAAVLTYSFADAMRVIVEHERRHVRQAERVLLARKS